MIAWSDKVEQKQRVQDDACARGGSAHRQKADERSGETAEWEPEARSDRSVRCPALE